MHITIQIIVLLQGVFLLYLLWNRKARYHKIPFRLLFASLLSLLLFVIGDEEGIIAGSEWDLFFLDSSLFIVFLFLFIRYVNSEREQFDPKDYLFFLPYLLYLFLEVIELLGDAAAPLEVLELIVELSFLSYLIFVVKSVLAHGSRQWVIYLIVPMSLLMCISMVNDTADLLGFGEILEELDSQVDVFLSLVVAIIFYFITFKLSSSSDEIIPENGLLKYSTSSLNEGKRRKVKEELTRLLREEKIYLKSKLSVSELASEIGLPRQYVTEVINTDLNTNFNDLINNYRVDEFTNRLTEERYTHYTLQGLAEEVGFSSKSSFYAIFKKIKGLTPSEYKEKLLGNS